jgi:hypothetical protein
MSIFYGRHAKRYFPPDRWFEWPGFFSDLIHPRKDCRGDNITVSSPGSKIIDFHEYFVIIFMRGMGLMIRSIFDPVEFNMQGNQIVLVRFLKRCQIRASQG